MLDGTIQPDWYCYITDDEQIIDLNKLNDSNLNNVITNCLLEVPQRINLELTDGTLTLKAGSVVIVPYGTNDLTNQYPIGSNFLNEYWEVQATQYVNKKFFVWAELQRDISRQRTETPDRNDRFITIYMDGGINGAVSAVSGTTFSNQIGYNTSTNEVHWYNTDGTYLATYVAFPIGIVACNDTYVFGSIKQVFNGMGYIGNVVWTDKDIKVLIPHGKSNNGSLDNIKLTSEFINFQSYNTGVYEDDARLVFYNDGGTGWFRGKGVFCQENKPSFAGVMTRWYNPSENQWYEVGNATSEFYKIYATMIASYKITNGVISNFKIDNTFRAVSYNEFKQKADKSEVLKTNQITNCLTEVPQKIKLELNNGTITLKAGSVVIVPYGTTDRSSEFSVGANFINSNFEVFDTSYNDNRFFVFAKTKKDLSYKYTGANTIGLFKANITTASGTGEVNNVSGDSASIAAYMTWYDTVNNYVKRSTDGVTWSSDLFSLPCAEITMVKDVGVNSARSFNGMGYIGRTLWLDKGVKVLVGTDRNADGTINNTEITTKLLIKTSHAYTEDRLLFYKKSGTLEDLRPDTYLTGLKKDMPTTVSGTVLYNYFCTDTLETYWTADSTTTNWQQAEYKTPIAVYGAISEADGKTITFLNPYQAFRAVDYNEFSNLRETVDTLNDTVDTKVSKSGDTMTGNLRIETNSGGVQVQGTGYKGIYTYSTDIDYTAVNQTNLQASVMSSYDKNNKCFAFNQHFIDNAGRVRNELRASRVINGTAYQAYLAFCVSTTGVPEIFINGHTLRAYLISTYTSGASGYNIWSNGYCEQWGVTTGGTDKTGAMITLLKTYKDTNYCLVASVNANIETLANAAPLVANCFNKTTSSFNVSTVYGGNGYNYRAYPFSWYACGYLASGQY